MVMKEMKLKGEYSFFSGTSRKKPVNFFYYYYQNHLSFSPKKEKWTDAFPSSLT